MMKGRWGSLADFCLTQGREHCSLPPPIFDRAGIHETAVIADGDEGRCGQRPRKGLPWAQGREQAPALGVELVVEGEEIGIDADVFEMQCVAPHHIVISRVF